MQEVSNGGSFQFAELSWPRVQVPARMLRTTFFRCGNDGSVNSYLVQELVSTNKTNFIVFKLRYIGRSVVKLLVM